MAEQTDLRPGIELQTLSSSGQRDSPSERRSHHVPGRSVVSGIKTFWTTNVSCTVDFSASRDHLALERTYLGWLRTSTAFATLGAITAQLFAASSSGKWDLGKPLATVCYAIAIVTVLLGTYRAWRQQTAMIQGKAIAGGREVNVMALASLLVFLLFLITVLAYI